VRRLRPAADKDRYAEMVPMRRFGTPEDIAAAVVFLASEQAGYITGDTLAVDGGFLAGGVLVRNLFDPPAATAA
jgi:NAD(P)-dependent dehydrogenase (short-subunit alcohol dehydrogenase family)